MRNLSHRFNVTTACVAVTTHLEELHKCNNNKAKRCAWLEICATNRQNLWILQRTAYYTRWKWSPRHISCSGDWNPWRKISLFHMY